MDHQRIKTSSHDEGASDGAVSVTAPGAHHESGNAADRVTDDHVDVDVD